MWLLGVDDYKLVQVLNPEEIPYAILSHTWGTGEVTFDDIEDLDVARTRQAWDKVQQTCRIARERDLSFVWIDTCCIDKRSSAELSEAINSMFAWYRGAAECYAYLGDYSRDDEDYGLMAMARCRWFSRGWTLQELIAPKQLYFYDATWTVCGNKISLVGPLTGITKIDRKALLDPDCLSTMPVARRMSWAAKRQTTRPEDLAYCLLGIFGVNMPLIYGEGANAFLRLQEAIALATEDLSLFAWTWPETSEAPRYSGLLARSPSHFERCGFLRNNENPLEYDSKSFTMVNHGFRFQTYLLTDAEKGQYLMPLHCHMHPFSKRHTVVLPLIKTGTGFVRHRTKIVPELSSSTMYSASWDSLPRTLTIPKVLHHADLLRVRRRFHDAFHFSVSIIGNWEVKLSATVPDRWDEAPSGTPWDASTGRYMTNSYSSFTGMLTGTIHDEGESSLENVAQFLIFFGFDGEYILGGRFKRETWIALSRSDTNSSIKTFKPKTVHLFDLPVHVLAQQHRMDYLRFTTYARHFYTKGLGPTNKELGQGFKSRTCVRAEERDWANEGGRVKANGLQLRTGLPYGELDMAIFARLETLHAGDYTTHRVHITIERMSESPHLHPTGTHVLNADGQPKAFPEPHQGPGCPGGDADEPPGASSTEQAPKTPLSSHANDPAPPHSQVPAMATQDTS